MRGRLMMIKRKTVFIAGHARLPQGMAAKNVYETLTITAEVDVKYGVILEASCTLATGHGREFIGRILRGTSLKANVDDAIVEIQTYYHGKATNALIAALKDLGQQFTQVQAEVHQV